jgi:Predicted Zn-dependent proteases
MVHEIGHMFGLKHCIYYNCIMNGSNHMKESSNKPLEMCPVCLRKLYSNIKFNILTRYEKLLEFCKKNGAFFEEWISFYTRIIAALEPLRGKMIESIKELNKADYVPTNSIFQQPFYSSITAHGQLLGDGLQQYGIPIQYATPRITNLLQQAKNSPRDKK